MDKIQTYFEDSVKEAGIFMNELDKARKEFPEFYMPLSEKKQEDISDEDYLKIYKISKLTNDTQVLFNKISAINHLAYVLNIELNKSCLQDVKGLMEFISNNIPFVTDYTVDSDNESIVEKNQTDFMANFEVFRDYFKKNLKND